ncbi:MFS transporter [Sphingobium yanoikuyae]|uniref:MFS transporter n=1 Tax=Sphingobium yanoikuyae TaxID=13690 RepID=A0A430BRK7_SPHYA|nr:MFS transporter [Sphingobium yanoikuyae]RSU55307.1 MFS transporter [Sphingobium yanoikuyae]
MRYVENVESDGKTTVFSVVVLCFFIALIDGFDSHSLSYVAPAMRQDLGLDLEQFGTVFSAGYAGNFIGTLAIGFAADRYGRRRLLVLCLALMGIFTLACAVAPDATTLAIFRFLGGLGMGGAFAPLGVLVADHTSARVRSALVVLMYSGIPLGAAVGGGASGLLMASYGWHFIFIIGGTIALLLVVPALLVTKERVPEVGASHDDLRLSFVGAVKGLLAGGRAPSVVALWTGVFVSYILTGFLVSFMPTLIHFGGYSVSQSAYAATLYQLGAVCGSFVISLVVGRFGPFRTVIAWFALGGLLVFMLGFTLGGGGAALFIILFAVGACLTGGHGGSPAMALQLFPERLRGTGIGTTLAVVRSGSILGPIIGAALLAAGLTVQLTLAVFAVLSLVSAALVFVALMKRPDPSLAD